MSIDHDKLLALCDVPGMPDQWDATDAYMHGWNDCLRALAQPAEADKCEFCVDGWEPFEGYGNVHHSKCDVCGGTGKKPAEAVEGSMVLRACNAYDAAAKAGGDDPDQCAQYPWMHAALTAALFTGAPDYPDGTDAEGFKGGDKRMADYITNRPALKEADADREDAVEYPDATGWAGPGHARVGDACPACPAYKSPRPKLVAEPVPGCNFARLNCEECGAGSYGLHYPPTDISEAVMQPGGVCPTCYQTMHITQAAPAQGDGMVFVGWSSKKQIDRLRTDLDLTGIMVHDEETSTRNVRMYAQLAAAPSQEGES